MKVYVDELPKKCADCPCLDYESDCQLLSGEDMDWKGINRKHTKCPLQSLADHDKQVRREVCEQVKNICNESCYMNRYNNIDKETLFNVLDQIQGETK